MCDSIPVNSISGAMWWKLSRLKVKKWRNSWTIHSLVSRLVLSNEVIEALSLSWLLFRHFANFLFNMSVQQVDREERPDVDKVIYWLSQWYFNPTLSWNWKSHSFPWMLRFRSLFSIWFSHVSLLHWRTLLLRVTLEREREMQIHSIVLLD